MKKIRPKRNCDGHDRYPAHTIVEEPLFESYYAAVCDELRDPFEAVGEVEDASEVHIDGGGMVHIHEPMIKATINGCCFTIYARQVEVILPVLRHITIRRGSAVSCFAGRWWQFLLTQDTALRLADEFEAKAEGMQGEIEAAWGCLEDAVDHANKDRLRVFSPNRVQTKQINSELNKKGMADQN